MGKLFDTSQYQLVTDVQAADLYPLMRSNANKLITAQNMGLLTGAGGFTVLSGFADLAAALTAIGSARVTLLVDTLGAVTANTIVPSNVTLMFIDDGGLQPSNGITLTIRGPIEAPPFKIFYNALAGQGTVSFSGNKLMRDYSSEWWGAVPDDATDCTAAFIAAFAAIFSAGGGTLQLGFGTYLCTGPVNATSGGVIYPPINAWTNSTIISIPIVIVGKGAPTWGDYKGGFGGTTIRGTTTSNPGGVSYPALLSGGKAAFVGALDFPDWTYVTFHLEKIRLATYNNPSIGGANFMMNNRGPSLVDVVVDVNVPETTGSSTAPSNPTAEVIGLAMAQQNNGQNSLNNVTVTGYKYGIFASDHFRPAGFVMAARCNYGFWFHNMAGMGWGTLYIYRCLHMGRTTGIAACVMDFTVQYEVDTDSGTWTQHAIGTTTDWEDPSDLCQGSLHYKLESPSGTQDYIPVFTGMTKVTWMQLNPKASDWKAFSAIGYQNGWTDFSSAFHLGGFCRRNGMLHLKGMIKNTGSPSFPSTVCTLPVGYRPPSPLICVLDVISNGALGRVDILSDGSVVVNAGNGAYVSLDGKSCSLT